MLSERQMALLILALASCLLLFPHIVRHLNFENYPAGDEPYKDALNAGSLAEGDLSGFNPFTAVLSLFGRHSLTALNAIPLAFGIISLAAAYLLLRELDAPGRMLFLFLWAMSPLFIYTFTVSGSMAFFTSLLSIGLVLFVKGRQTCIPFFIASSLFGILPAIITALSISALARHRNRLFWQGISISLSTGIIISGILYFLYGNPANYTETTTFLLDTITAFGAERGFSIFALLLAAIGIIKSWQSRSKNAWLWVFLVSVALITFIEPDYRAILNIALVYLAAIGLIALIKRSWEAPLIRNLTIILLLFGMLFTTTAYLGYLANLAPDIATIESLGNLRTADPGEVLSHYRNTYWIEYIADKPAALDYTNPDRITAAQSVFSGRDETQLKQFLESNDIRYIYVDNQTRELMRDDQNNLGLEFIMENSPHFRKLSSRNDIILWRYYP